MPTNKAFGKFRRSRILNIGSGSCLPLSVLLSYYPLTVTHSTDPLSGPQPSQVIPTLETSLGALISMGSSWFFVLKSQPFLLLTSYCLSKGIPLPPPVLLHIALLYCLPGSCHIYMKCLCSCIGLWIVCFISPN